MAVNTSKLARSDLANLKDEKDKIYLSDFFLVI